MAIDHAWWYGARVEGQWVYVGPAHDGHHIIEFPPTSERRIVSTEVLRRDYEMEPEGEDADR